MITPQQVKEKTIERFWTKIKFGGENDCWEWQGARVLNEYGIFSIENSKRLKKMMCAHRYLFIQLHGDLPTHLKVLHKCDNPSCCNPNHLRSGTQQENMDEMYAKGRGRKDSPKGSKASKAKLHESDIPIIRERIRNGERNTKIAKDYNVNKQCIWSIAHNISWKHVA